MHPVLRPFLCGIKKTSAQLEQWVGDSIIFLPQVNCLHLRKIIKVLKTARCIARKGHTLEQFVFFRKISNKKLTVDEICSRMKELQVSRDVLSHIITTPKASDQYFHVLVGEGEVSLARSWGVPLFAWEDLKGNGPKPGKFAYTSTCHP